MPNCVILGCKSANGRNSEKFQTFPLPTNSQLREEWISCIFRENYIPGKSTRICENHFEISDFVPQSENVDKRGREYLKRKLQPNAVPSLDLKLPKISKTTIVTPVKEHSYSQNPGLEQMSSQRINVSSDSSQDDIEVFETENVEIVSEHEDKDAIIEKQKKIIQDLKKEKLKSDLIIEKVETIFDGDQMQKLVAPATSTFHYSMEHITKGVKTYFTCGKSGYLFIRNELKLPLPAIGTLQNHLVKICCEPGSLHDFFKMMEQKVKCMEEESDRTCSMSIDEMSIQPKVEYDLATQSYTGYVTLPLSKAQQKQLTSKQEDPEKQLAYHALSGKY